MKKLGIFFSLLVVFSFLPGVIGCTSTTPNTTTNPTTTSPTTAAPTTATTAFKPIVLKYADYKAEKPGYFGTITEMGPWLKAIEAVTNGRIKMNVYDNGSLMNQVGAEVNTGKGVADIAFGARMPTGVVPMKDVMTLPPLQGDTTAMENLMIHWFVMYDYFKKDWADMNLIEVGPLHLHASLPVTAKKPVRNMSDLKGLTLGSTKTLIVRLMSDCGSIIVPISNLDMYDALSKGMVDGGVWNWEGPFLFGWVDQFKPGYFIDCGGIVREGGSSNAVMNLDTYNSLPKDLRDKVDIVLWRWASVYFAAHIDATVPPFMKEAEKRGIQYIHWTDDEKAKLTVAKNKVIDTWIAEMEKVYKRGAEAAQLAKIYNDAASKYVPPAYVPVQPQLALDEATKAKWSADWDAVWGKPTSTWGMDYKAYPNQTGLHTLEGNTFKAWPK